MIVRDAWNRLGIIGYQPSCFQMGFRDFEGSLAVSCAPSDLLEDVGPFLVYEVVFCHIFSKHSGPTLDMNNTIKEMVKNLKV